MRQASSDAPTKGCPMKLDDELWKRDLEEVEIRILLKLLDKVFKRKDVEK